MNRRVRKKDTAVFELPLSKLAANLSLEAALENDELLSGTKCDFGIEAYRENKHSVIEAYGQGSVISARVVATLQDMNFYINSCCIVRAFSYSSG